MFNSYLTLVKYFQSTLKEEVFIIKERPTVKYHLSVGSSGIPGTTDLSALSSMFVSVRVGADA